MVLRVLEDSPDLVQRLSAIMGTPAPSRDGLLVTKAEYAGRLSYSVRKLDQLIAAGLPTSGKGRALRIPVEAADQWVTVHMGGATAENDLEVAALASARRRAHRRAL